MEMMTNHAVTLLIRRVVFIGNDDDQTRLRNRILKLVGEMVDGLAAVPHAAVLFRPRRLMLQVLAELKGEPDFLLVIPGGAERSLPEGYDERVIRYEVHGSAGLGRITLKWAPMEGGFFSQTSVMAEEGEEGLVTFGLVKPQGIKERGPRLPLRVVYEPATERDD